MAVGLVLTASSLWQMTHFSLSMHYEPILWSGITQGFGVALVYIPLSTVAFTTLPGTLRNEGTSFFNLMRNLGSSVGISVVTFLLTQNTQKMHAALANNITPFNMAANPAAAGFDIHSTASLLALNGMITNQGAMIGYLDDFKMMMVLTLSAIPFLLLIRNVKHEAGSAAAAVAE
jgi:DHA2 family multidrug resistance protein